MPHTLSPEAAVRSSRPFCLPGLETLRRPLWIFARTRLGSYAGHPVSDTSKGRWSMAPQRRWAARAVPPLRPLLLRAWRADPTRLAARHRREAAVCPKAAAGVWSASMALTVDCGLKASAAGARLHRPSVGMTTAQGCACGTGEVISRMSPRSAGASAACCRGG